MQIGDQIRAARQRRGWTQKQLAERVTNPTTGLPLTPSAISEIERGSVEPRPAVLLAIGQLLGIAGESLLGVSGGANRRLRVTWGLTYVQPSGEYIAARLPEESPMSAHVIEQVRDSFGPDIWGMVVDGESIGVPSDHRIGHRDEFILEPPGSAPKDGQLVIAQRVDGGPKVLRIAQSRADAVYLAHPDGESAGDTIALHPARWVLVALVKEHRRIW